MSRALSAQEIVHWLEAGGGAKIVRWAAIIVSVVALSALVAWKQFRGLPDEATLREADVARQIVRGQGFTTQVHFPQTAAWLAERGHEAADMDAVPELRTPPLYPLLVAATWRVLPRAAREKLFSNPPVPPDGYAADYWLLGLNVVLLWIVAAQSWSLARRLFGDRAALVALVGVIGSVGIWEGTVRSTGLPLLMVSLLAVGQAIARGHAAAEAGWRTVGVWAGLAGLASAAAGLTDYPAALIAPVALGAVLLGPGEVGPRLRAAAVFAVVFLAAVSPWAVHNIRLTGSPVGWAAQDVALRVGDSTAEPADVRATLDAKAPDIDLPKLVHKGLAEIEANFADRFWRGALLLGAFFITGTVYAFREPTARHVQRFALAAVLLLPVAQGFLNSGEATRLCVVALVPLVVVLGAGFLDVLAESVSDGVPWKPTVVVSVVALLHAVPLARSALEPRRIHFTYPPYYPSLLRSVAQAAGEPGGLAKGWFCDVPAGAAWYGDAPVWAQPVDLHDLYRLQVATPFRALLLTPHTLQKPFFTELAGLAPTTGGAVVHGLGEWGEIYSGLVTGRFPPAFPFSSPHKVAPDLILLIDPRSTPTR